MARALGSRAQIARSRAAVPSVLPSSTSRSSQLLPSRLAAALTSLSSTSTLSSSLYSGTTMVTSMVLDPECWVPGRRAPPRGSRGWSPMDGAAGARSRPRPKIQDPRPVSWHPLDDRRPHQAGEGQPQLLPDPDRPLVLRIGRADVRPAPGLDEVVLIAVRCLVHPR